MNLLIVLGHPRTASLSGALALAFGEGARKIGADVRQLALATLEFDPHVRTESPGDQALEDDLSKARDLILWAEHLVVVYSTWRATAARPDHVSGKVSAKDRRLAMRPSALAAGLAPTA
ncbi:MAG: hypothetical protein HHJ16_00190 [Polaromonas sp.]|uniref:NAD(P)H-dependent oxidoreductase n=1 Tax=Polaromonas sp. TaxID=1869339 RepID=UPI00185F0832|nr:NAD(P)H-dependent oxidoreductase [Polaromonas sp.]NMM08683.1 hypothetical protein [Polaromonas sp.]